MEFYMKHKHESLDPIAAADRLKAVREKRGYLMPHHGLLALTAPALLEGYDACYTALTLGKRHLSERDKEFIWLGILAVKEEFLATQHVGNFLKAGGNDKHVIMAVRMAAFAQGASAFEFAESYWSSHVPKMNGRGQYLHGLHALVDDASVQETTLHLAMAAIHTSIGNWAQLKWHISATYDLGVAETELAEALSYSMFTGSIPHFIEGCAVWHEMIKAGEVDATKPFQDWAAVDQSGPK
jgi:alkylhydroperoxidase/carboxymuconolactone decarboxylase family protein YurZ